MTNQSGTFETKRSLRYYTLAKEEPIERILFVLHGYGQLATYFIKKFEGHSLKNTLIVAPEGMHRFYLNGTSGRVGASWMTKEWREQDILENSQTLNGFASAIIHQYPTAKITVLGFSQGGATAARWISDQQIPCEHFISWGSVFPPDISAEVLQQLSMKRTFVVGNEDPFFPETIAKEVIQQHQNLGFECVTFEGKHDISLQTLEAVLSV